MLTVSMYIYTASSLHNHCLTFAQNHYGYANLLFTQASDLSTAFVTFYYMPQFLIDLHFTQAIKHKAKSV